MTMNYREFCFCAFYILTILNLVRADNSTCDLNWVFIDIHYRNVDARPTAYSYGLFIGAGTSSQNQSLWPAIAYNETRLATHDFCSDTVTPHCLDSKFTHGHFGADASETWAQTTQYTSMDVSTIDQGLNTTHGTDNLNIFTHYFDPSPPFKTLAEDMPLMLISDYTSDEDVFFNSGSLGLGSGSTVLKNLVASGSVGRNVIGFYLGTAYPRAGGTQNGSLVLGGYDAGRISGPVHEYKRAPVSPTALSPYKIHVQQLSLSTSDGSTIPLITDNGFDAAISTNQYELDLPPVLISRLAAALGAKPIENTTSPLQAASAFDGNITITLDDGYAITFPPEWITNASNLTPFSASTLLANESANATEQLIFGTAFLHHTYMTIDHDAATFSLADAKVFGNYVQPRSLCPGTLPVATKQPQLNKFVAAGLIGAILGGLVGGTALACCGFFVLRKTLQHRRAKQAMLDVEVDGAKFQGPQKKSSLRTGISHAKERTKRTWVRFAPKHDIREVTPRFVRKASISDSDSDLGKDHPTTVSTKEIPNMNGAIEMKSIQHKDSTLPQVRQQTAIMQPLPTPNQFSNMYGDSPMQTPMITPRTGNPLLGNARGFTEFADDDDSDLPRGHQRHTRAPSEQLRTHLGLKINTSFNAQRPSKPPVEVRASTKSFRDRQKPAPLPLGISSDAARGSKTQANFVKKNPVRALFERADEQPSNGKKSKPSARSRMFPPPQR